MVIYAAATPMLAILVRPKPDQPDRFAPTLPKVILLQSIRQLGKHMHAVLSTAHADTLSLED